MDDFLNNVWVVQIGAGLVVIAIGGIFARGGNCLLKVIIPILVFILLMLIPGPIDEFAFYLAGGGALITGLIGASKDDD